jgi:cytochrome c-type biogenesis protein CcmH/NrfF
MAAMTDFRATRSGQRTLVRSLKRLVGLGPVIVLSAAVALGTGLLQGQSADRAKTLGIKLMCNCGCGDSAGQCSHPGAPFTGPCDVAKKELAELNTHLSAGESDGAILQGFVTEYGEKILAEPPAHGFNMLAWMIPGIAFALGLAVVVGFIRYWRHRPVAAGTEGPAISPEMLARAHREIDRQTSD